MGLKSTKTNANQWGRTMVYEKTATRTGQLLKLQYFPLPNKKHGNDNLLITHSFQALNVKFYHIYFIHLN